MMKLLIYPMFLLLLAPCNKNKMTATETTKQDLSKVQIIYETSVCFGKCPAYILTIDGATAAMTYTGKSNVDKMGRYTKKISAAELRQLIDAFEAANFNSLEDKYLGKITDFPSKYTSYIVDGKVKKIQDRDGGPDKLHQIEKMLESIANSEGWTKEEADH